MHWRGKWQPAPVLLPGESQGRGSLVGCRLWGWTQGWTRLKRLGSSTTSFSKSGTLISLGGRQTQEQRTQRNVTNVPGEKRTENGVSDGGFY